MNGRFVVHIIGRLLVLEALCLLLPLGIALWDTGGWNPFGTLETMAFSSTIIGSFVIGVIVSFLTRQENKHLGIREGLAIVTLGWVILALAGSIPLTVYFYSTGDGTGSHYLLLAFTDGFFETMSGLSTTGASILTDIEALPRGLLFWRSFTHWLGGMGIITLALAIFPAMGVAGYQMFRGEVPGPTADRLRPRLTETAKILWGVYVLLTVIQCLCLMLAGMDLFDASCHAFGTLATGGFSTRNGSVSAFDSATIEWIIIVFMFLAGTNFLLHYRVLFHRDFKVLSPNREFHVYVLTVIGATLLIAVVLSGWGLPDPSVTQHHFQDVPRTEAEHVAHVAAEEAKFDTLESALRTSAFQVLAVVTTTGFGTADFDVWPRTLGLLLILLMFMGACAGSTSGGMKIVRIMVVFKAGWRELRKIVRPHLMAPLKVKGEVVAEPKVMNIVGFFILFLLFNFCIIVLTY